MTTHALRSPLTVRAYAKVNLTLRILARRPDGYHELRTVLQSLDLHDRLTFWRTDGPLRIECDDERVPVDERNLVWRAAQMMWRAAGHRGAVADLGISIRKRIPMEAGFGGGSSDAAATLRTLARIWRTDVTHRAVEAMAASLGADVPFFLEGGTVLGLDRGDTLFRLADIDRRWVVLARPDFGVSTADAYRWFDGKNQAGRTRAAARPSPFPFPVGDAGNDLEAPVAERHPRIRQLIRAMWRHGASWAAMSGSGSACFAVCASKAEAAGMARRLAATGCHTWVSRTLTAAEFRAGSEPFEASRRGR